MSDAAETEMCAICGMEFEHEDDLNVHLLDCEAEDLDP